MNIYTVKLKKENTLIKIERLKYSGLNKLRTEAPKRYNIIINVEAATDYHFKSLFPGSSTIYAEQ